MPRAHDAAMERGGMNAAPLSEAHVGDTVIAEDGAVGHIDRIIRTESRAPMFMIVASRRRIRRRYPVIPSSLVTRVDRSRRRVHVRGHRRSVGTLPEHLPIVV
jgi:hypothetical protein